LGFPPPSHCHINRRGSMRNEEVPGPQPSPNDFRKVLRKKHAAGPTLTAQMSGNLLFEIRGIKNLADSGTEHDVWVTPALCLAPVAGRPGENPVHSPESARLFGQLDVTFSATAALSSSIAPARRKTEREACRRSKQCGSRIAARLRLFAVMTCGAKFAVRLRHSKS
jgi:hypothetical protein